MAKDPRKVVIKELNAIIDSAGVENADMLKNSLKLMSTCPCYEGKETKEKVKREPTERNIFMGECMRSAEKGGQGKGMAVCSTEWNEKKGNIKEVKK